MKRLLSVILCLLLAAALSITAMAAGVTSFSVSTPNNSVHRGDTVTFTVKVSSSEPATSYGFMLSYDASVFELVNGSCTVGGTLVSSFNNGFAFMFQAPTAYSGTVGTVTFKVKENASFGSYTISGSASVKNGANTVDAYGASKTVVISCAHSYGSWTKVNDTQHKHICSVCQQEEIENHHWDSGKVTKQPNCKEAGVKTFTCTGCKATRTETIAKTTEHKYGNWTKSNDSQHIRVCTVCTAEEITNHSWSNGKVTKQPNCKENGVKTYTCTFCSATKTETVAKSTEHKYGSWVQMNDAQHMHQCSVCQKEEVLNHAWDNGIVTVEPNCKKAGVKTFTCAGCNATKTAEIEKTAVHKFGGWTETNDSLHKHICSICQKKETAAHTWNSGSITKQATCKEKGIKTFTCTGCNATKTEKIAKLTNHVYDHTCDTDCNECGATRTTTHNYKTTLSKDKQNHWHECSVCKDKKDVATHTPGAKATETKAQSCLECGYVIKAALGHTHQYTTTWSTDENGHWNNCSGCDDMGNYETHDFENNCDPDCSICGYSREIKHTFQEEWVQDADNHWHVCTGCGLKEDEAVHEPGAEATATTNQVCTICNYEIAPVLGIEETTQRSEKTNTAENQSNAVNFDSLFWIIVIIGIAAIGTTIAVAVSKKRKAKI